MPASANPPGYQTLLSGREDAQGFSLSFRLALQNFLLIASLLPASAHVSCQECRLRRLGISASLLPPQLVLAPPARTLLPERARTHSYSLRTAQLPSPSSSSHLVNRENFRDSIIHGPNKTQMAHSVESGRRFIYKGPIYKV